MIISVTLAGKKSRDGDKPVDITEWSERVREKYHLLLDVVLDNLPGMLPILEFVLSVKSILNIKGCNLPFAGIILGPPGSLKTATIQLFRGYKYSFYTDSFTAKALVSHNSGVDEKKLKQIDMLPKIKDRIFLTPELAPIFSSKDEDLLQVLGTLTRVADGQGYESDTGSQGHRGYSEHMMFVWIGASVEIPFKVHKHLAVLGPRLYFFRQPREVHTEDDYLFYYQNVSDNFTERLDRIRFALYEYLAYFELHPNIEQQQPEEVVEDEDEIEGNVKGNEKVKAKAKTKRIIIHPPPKIPFTGKSPEEAAEKEIIDIYLIRLAELLARLRAVVPTWHTRDTQGSDYGYGIAIVEEPNRAITQLRNLARGHALSQGRDYITVEDDIPLLIKVVISTASIERSLIFDLLIANNGELSTTQICEFLNTTKHTALRTMTELKAVGLVDVIENTGYNNNESKMCLKPDLFWFLSSRFKELKDWNGNGKEKVDCEEKYPPRKAPNLPNLLYEINVINKIESCLRGGENSSQSNFDSGAEAAYECNRCDLRTNSRFDYRWHMENSHGIEWDMTDQATDHWL